MEQYATVLFSICFRCRFTIVDVNRSYGEVLVQLTGALACI